MVEQIVQFMPINKVVSKEINEPMSGSNNPFIEQLFMVPCKLVEKKNQLIPINKVISIKSHSPQCLTSVSVLGEFVSFCSSRE